METTKTHTQGEMAEWSIAAVLKTVEGHTSGGSNPSLSAIKQLSGCFFFGGNGTSLSFLPPKAPTSGA